MAAGSGTVNYYSFRGKSLSDDWYVVLQQAEREGVYFILNSGHRTMDEQWYLYNGYINRRPGFNLAAYPSSTAPHIRVGRQDHALDINDNTIRNLQGWLAENGVRTHLPVSGESWHLEVISAAELHELANKLRKPKTQRQRIIDNPLREGARHKDVRTIQVWLKRLDCLDDDFKVAKEVGTFGPVLKNGVKRFQRRFDGRLKVDGVVGVKTYDALKRRQPRRGKK